jgi:hypothetical protein
MVGGIFRDSFVSIMLLNREDIGIYPAPPCAGSPTAPLPE